MALKPPKSYLTNGLYHLGGKMIKITFLLILLVGCGNLPEDRRYGLEASEYAGNADESVDVRLNRWIESKKGKYPERALMEIERLLESASLDGEEKLEQIYSKLINNVSIREVSAIEGKNIGQCTILPHWKGDTPKNEIIILNRQARQKTNEYILGKMASDETLEALTSYVYLHEMGHCFLSLAHVYEEGAPIIMNTLVGKGGLLNFMEDPEPHIEALARYEGERFGLHFHDEGCDLSH